MRNRLIDDIKAVVGLFIPMPSYTFGIDKKNTLSNNVVKWGFTLTIGEVPLGWIMIIVAIVVKVINL